MSVTLVEVQSHISKLAYFEFLQAAKARMLQNNQNATIKQFETDVVVVDCVVAGIAVALSALGGGTRILKLPLLRATKSLWQNLELNMPDALESYPLILEQKVIWGDMDAFGHVNNTVYFRYFEDARMAYFDRTGVSKYKDRYQKGPILASTQCDFRLPLSYPDKIFIAARASIAGPRKVTIDCVVYSEHFQSVAAEGRSLIVFYDYNKACSCEVPEHLTENISKFERGLRGS